MKAESAKILAQQLLDSEFEQFDYNPKLYISSIGWDTNSEKFGSINKLQGQLVPIKEDYAVLAAIIESINTEDTLEATESNTVSDFLNNCVAEKILSKLS